MSVLPRHESCDHLFAQCPRLRPLWACVCPSSPALADIARDDAPISTHKAILLVFWCVWKSRNGMIFDRVTLDTEAIVEMMLTHLQLWIHRVLRNVDSSELLVWCSSFHGVT
ncbi:unnamed protein product [Urochloa humidicola]